MKRPLEFALGLIGGMLGISWAFFAMVIESITGAVKDANLLPSAIAFFSVLGIIGACIVVNSKHSKTAGWSYDNCSHRNFSLRCSYRSTVLNVWSLIDNFRTYGCFQELRSIALWNSAINYLWSQEESYEIC